MAVGICLALARCGGVSKLDAGRHYMVMKDHWARRYLENLELVVQCTCCVGAIAIYAAQNM